MVRPTKQTWKYFNEYVYVYYNLFIIWRFECNSKTSCRERNCRNAKLIPLSSRRRRGRRRRRKINTSKRRKKLVQLSGLQLKLSQRLTVTDREADRQTDGRTGSNCLIVILVTCQSRKPRRRSNKTIFLCLFLIPSPLPNVNVLHFTFNAQVPHVFFIKIASVFRIN